MPSNDRQESGTLRQKLEDKRDHAAQRRDELTTPELKEYWAGQCTAYADALAMLEVEC